MDGAACDAGGAWAWAAAEKRQFKLTPATTTDMMRGINKKARLASRPRTRAEDTGTASNRMDRLKMGPNIVHTVCTA